jgi:MFS family permease
LDTHKKSILAVSFALFNLGLAFATWASRVPDVRDTALLTATTLGYVLLFRGMGTVIMMPIIAWALNHFGPKRVALFMGTFVAITLFPIALMKSWFALALLMTVVGMCSSGFNISVNALGSVVESETGQSHMSKIHSWFGVGTVVGALIGTLTTRFSWSAMAHFGLVSSLILLVLFFVARYLPNDESFTRQKSGFQWPHGGLIALGIITFLAATIETSIMNWVSLFFTDHIQASADWAPLGYTVFAGALLVMRVFGDRLKTHFGARNLLVGGALSTITGLIMAVFAPNFIIAIMGMVFTGAGVSLSFPMLFSAAGREGAIALTSVASFGYVGGMVSQPVMGWVVETFELSGGFLFIAGVTAVIGYLASRARLLAPTR